jgi:hypothetical protein
MSTAAIVGILVALVVVAGLVWYLMGQRRRTEQLQTQYGPEYSRLVSEVGNQKRAEEELLKRQERVEHLEIRPLLADQRDLFGQRWRADELVDEVMMARGYPVADFNQRAADLSVHHARVIDNYRAARELADRHRRNAASTEDLRRAMVHYRELFEDLLEDRENARVADRPVDRPVDREVRRVADQTAGLADGARPTTQPIRREGDARR